MNPMSLVSMIVALAIIPKSIKPLSPNKTCTTHRTPTIIPKNMSKPLRISILWNAFAFVLYFNNFFHIQDPKLVDIFIDRNDLAWITSLCTQLTHKDFVPEVNLQISFKQHTLFTSPSSFGLHIYLFPTEFCFKRI